MIIPRGTEIKLNTHGQLSIKTPGNLVIQNSGTYSELESTNGSIRIEDNVQVEAVSVRAAQACFIQGTLTAWRVHAKKIALEDRAKAYIMLQESEQLELSKTSRLVGNFANEKEIYLMLGKFTPQLKELPTSFDMQSSTGFDDTKPALAPRAESELPEPLRKALAILEHETKRTDLDGPSAEVLRELVFALRERDMQRTGLVYRDAFTELGVPSELMRTAYDLIDSYFRRRT
ncbi:MAG TPA: hypothetical protein VIL97_10095 [Thermoanaerobaculia bacterium]|nr:hypothetical protein [Rhodothermia bacterium]